MEIKFIDGVSRTFFSLGILNDEACLVAPEEAGEGDVDEGRPPAHIEDRLDCATLGQEVAVPVDNLQCLQIDCLFSLQH